MEPFFSLILGLPKDPFEPLFNVKWAPTLVLFHINRKPWSMHGPPPRHNSVAVALVQVRDNLNKRLQAGILRDWTRGSSPLKFNKRWLPYASHGTEGPCFHKFPSVRDGTIT